MSKKSIVIQFSHVSKKYVKQRLRYGMLSEVIGGWFTRRVKHKHPSSRNVITALQDASFSVRKGEMLGIIGSNGAGKSTVLKLISRVTVPDGGVITVDGRIGALIELGAGLHPELTGRENIYLYGAILGMKRREVSDRFHDIVSFADINDFLDMPIKRYSSGMYARLGFAVAVSMQPDILLIDEVLAVGDESFQTKCFQKMRSLRDLGTTIVFVSHNLDWVSMICNRVLLLEHGRIKKDGKPHQVISTYREHI